MTPLLLFACSPLGAEPAQEQETVLTLEGVRLERADEDGLALAESERVTVGESGKVLAEEIRVESPRLVIDAREARWYLQAGRAEFVGEVEAKRGAWSLRCDALDVELGEDHRILRARARGSVQAERAPWTGGGEQAELEVETGLLVLTGAPWVASPKGRLEGERITMAWDREEVECQGCSLRFDLPELPDLPGDP